VSDVLLSDRELALVDAVARRVLELLDEREAPRARSRLVSAAELAEALGVSRDWIYRHAEDELEPALVRLGADDGSRSEHGGRRLRFDLEKAVAAASGRQASERSQPADPPAPVERAHRPRRRPPGSEVPLLPVQGRAKAR
jgi:predicted DNA-binding transcriptional regulator AlpA